MKARIRPRNALSWPDFNILILTHTEFLLSVLPTFYHFFLFFQDLSPELAAMLLASVIGGYTLIGGLGATFYVSYFNTALIFVLILMLVVEVFYNPFNNPENPFGGAGILYDYISCWKAPNGNRDESYLTFYSPGM